MTFISLQVFILRDFRKMLIIGLIIGIDLLLSSLIALIVSRQTQSQNSKEFCYFDFYYLLSFIWIGIFIVCLMGLFWLLKRR